MEKRPRGNPNWRKGASGNPSGKRKNVALERRDGWVNSASGHGTSRDRRTLTYFGVDVVTDLEARQLWRSEWLCKRIIETVPGEANRRGWDLNIKNKKQAADIQARAEELDLDGAMTRAAEYERAYGGAAIFPVIGGAQGDLVTPLDETKIASVDALHVLEPCELYPSSFYTDLSSPKFGRPETYRLMPLASTRRGVGLMQLVHESRLVVFPGKRVSKQTQAGQREGWGDSELSHSKQMISDAGLTWGSVATLLHEFGQGHLGIKGLMEIMTQADGPSLLERRMQAYNLYKSSMRVSVGDVEDSYTRIATPVSGLDGLLVQQAQWVAAVADMPVTVLFGMSPAGLNATGDMDVRNWYAKIEKIDACHYAPRREQLVKLLLLENGGKEPDLWSIEPRPLWSPSEKEEAETRLIDATADEKWVAMGAASPDDIATSHWKGDKYSRDIVIDWAAREEQKKIDEENAEAAMQAMATGVNEPPVPGQEKPDPKAEAE